MSSAGAAVAFDGGSVEIDWSYLTISDYGLTVIGFPNQIPIPESNTAALVAAIGCHYAHAHAANKICIPKAWCYGFYLDGKLHIFYNESERDTLKEMVTQYITQTGNEAEDINLIPIELHIDESECMPDDFIDGHEEANSIS